jgi:hypothetical protein
MISLEVGGAVENTPRETYEQVARDRGPKLMWCIRGSHFRGVLALLVTRQFHLWTCFFIRHASCAPRRGLN